MESSSDAVWVQKPLIAFGTIEGKADSECAKYGKSAVFQGTLETRPNPAGGSAAAAGGASSVFVPIYAFDCE